MLIKFDRTAKKPLYLQIKEQIAHLVAEGLLPAGSRLPATRDLAASLGVSRNTVVDAYKELEVAGLITSQLGKGAFICMHIPPEIAHVRRDSKTTMSFEGLFSTTWMRSQAPLLSVMEQISTVGNDPEIISFATTFPDHELFPLAEFRECIQVALRRYGADLLSSGSPRGFRPFLEYLPTFLTRRSLICDPKDILIVNGIQQALSLIGRLFIDPGDTVVLENLSYPGALGVFRSLQANCIGIPMDNDGIRIDVLENVLRRKEAKLLYTIPSFQNPTGISLPLEKRKRLVDICREHQVIIVEDDYAYGLSFGQREILPLKTWDECGGIIYLGSFSEILFPGIRLSWVLAARAVLDRLLLIKESADLYTNRILQGAVLTFIQRGYLEKHLKRKRMVYRKRHEVMLKTMERQFPPEVTWSIPGGGLFQWIDLPTHFDVLSLLLRARERGVVFAPDRMFCVEEWERSGFRLGYAGVKEEKIEKGIEILGALLKEMIPEGGTNYG